MPKKKNNPKQRSNGADQFDTFYSSYAGKYSSKKAKPAGMHPVVKVVFILVVVLAVCLCILGGMILFGGSQGLLSGDFNAGVTIAGVDVGGMSKNDAIDAVTQAVGNTYTTQSMAVTVRDQQLVIEPAFSGASLDVEAAVEAAVAENTPPNKKVDILPYLSLNTEGIRNLVHEFAKKFPTEGVESSWEIVNNVTQEEESSKTLTITVGSVYYDLSEDALLNAILDAYNTRRFQLDYACNQMNVAAIDLDAIYAQNCFEAVDATLDPETFQVTPSQDGITFDLDAAKAALNTAQPGQVLEIPMVALKPEFDTEHYESMLFRDVLGTYTAKSSSSKNRDTNLRLACEALDGTILYPGDTFGYNNALGERTPEKGYKPAASYVGGATVDTYGGGICQPSSALYYCVLLADLEVVQRHCHSYVSSYVPMGMDATVDWSGPDFKFRNNSNFPVRIDAKASGGNVTISLVGTDEKDYYVKMEYTVLEREDFEVIEKEMDPAETFYKDGDVITSPYTGYKVQTYKCKYDKETDALISREKEAYSHYSKRDKVICRFPTEEPTEPPTTEPTVPPATEPPVTEPPVTEPTVTEPPATEPPTTEPTEPDPPPTTLPGEIGEATG